jgi:polysaccharide pyruvyl transferase WcaK-like protein
MEKSKKIKKFIIWGGWYGSRNIGDQLLLISISDMLFKTFNNCELTILTAKPELVKEYFSIDDNSTVCIIKPRSQLLKMVSKIKSCDLFIFGGGVPFFNQIRQVLNMLVILILTKIFKKLIFLWCVSSYSINNKIARFIYRKIIDSAIEITCRDKYTKSIFTSFGTSKKLDIIPDPVFSMKNFEEEEARTLLTKYIPLFENMKLFALTPRTLRTKDFEAQTHYNIKTEDDINHQIELYSIALDWLVENGFTPIFIPMNTNPPDDDLIIFREIIEKSKHPQHAYRISEAIPPRAAPSIYSFCYGSLVSRVHGSITSFLGECPPIMYAFESKHLGVMESMGLDDLISRVDSDPKNIVQLLEYLIQNRHTIIEKIKIEKQNLAKRAWNPISTISRIVGD